MKVIEANIFKIKHAQLTSVTSQKTEMPQKLFPLNLLPELQKVMLHYVSQKVSVPQKLIIIPNIYFQS